MTSLAFISDIHVRKANDEAYALLLKFLRHEAVQEVESVYLLGDIFDLMAGNHTEYKVQYTEFFELLKTYLKKGKQVYYFEGNHDLNLQRLFKSLFGNFKNFSLHNEPLIQKIDGKIFYFSHGDEVLTEDYGYRIYKAFITSFFGKFLANFIVPYQLLKSLGEKASARSRKRSEPSVETKEKIKNRYRLEAKRLAAKGCDIIIMGHNHVADYYHFDYKNHSKWYLNNGFPLKDKTFYLLEKGEVKTHEIH